MIVEENSLLLRMVTNLLRSGATNIEDLEFIVKRGCFQTLVNRHVLGSPASFIKLFQKRKKIITEVFIEMMIDLHNYTTTINQNSEYKNLMHVKKAYHNLFKQRKRRHIRKTINISLRLVCAGVGKFTARFVGCYDNYTIISCKRCK